MSWPPTVGEPLPRAGDAWSEAHKWTDWILAERGHGPEWRKVLHVSSDDIDLIWAAIAEAVLVEPVSRILDRGEHGLNCRIDVRLAVAERSALIRTVWHYQGPGAAPRLVSAYPKL